MLYCTCCKKYTQSAITVYHRNHIFADYNVHTACKKCFQADGVSCRLCREANNVVPEQHGAYMSWEDIKRELGDTFRQEMRNNGTQNYKLMHNPHTGKLMLQLVEGYIPTDEDGALSDDEMGDARLLGTERIVPDEEAFAMQTQQWYTQLQTSHAKLVQSEAEKVQMQAKIDAQQAMIDQLLPPVDANREHVPDFTSKDLRILKNSMDVDEIKQSFDALRCYKDPNAILTQDLTMERLKVMYGLIEKSDWVDDFTGFIEQIRGFDFVRQVMKEPKQEQRRQEEEQRRHEEILTQGFIEVAATKAKAVLGYRLMEARQELGEVSRKASEITCDWTQGLSLASKYTNLPTINQWSHARQ